MERRDSKHEGKRKRKEKELRREWCESKGKPNSLLIYSTVHIPQEIPHNCMGWMVESSVNPSYAEVKRVMVLTSMFTY